MNKTLLVIGYVWPEPNSSAAGTRMLQLINAFISNGYRVIYGSAAALSSHRYPLEDIGVSEVLLELNNESFDTYIQELCPSVVLFDRFFTEEQFGWRVEKFCPAALKILDTEDFHSLRLFRQEQVKAQAKIQKDFFCCETDVTKNYEGLLDSDTAKREVAAMYRVDLSVMISPVEIDLLVNYFGMPERLFFYCPLIAGSEQQESVALRDFHERQHFISIGNFRHEPNWDAVLYLKEFVWPQIRAKLPEAELHIYGAYPPPKATQLHNSKQGFLVKGWAEDAATVLSQARVLLAPLRFGAGIKGKLFDAMAVGTPSVTTRVGAEGMLPPLERENINTSLWGGAVAETLEYFIEAAVGLYWDESLWLQAQSNAVQHYQDFTQQDYLADFNECVNALVDNIALHRRQNFYGAILRQEMHQSAKFKGLWIEAKNRNL